MDFENDPDARATGSRIARTAVRCARASLASRAVRIENASAAALTDGLVTTHKPFERLRQPRSTHAASSVWPVWIVRIRSAWLLRRRGHKSFPGGERVLRVMFDFGTCIFFTTDVPSDISHESHARICRVRLLLNALQESKGTQIFFLF